MKEIQLQQSRNWSSEKDLKWLIDNAEFVFTNTGHKGNRPRIVTREKVNGMNCFEIDNDRYGIIVCSETEFDKFWEESITEKSYNVADFIAKFLVKWGAGEFVYPNPNFLTEFLSLFIKKDKVVCVELK